MLSHINVKLRVFTHGLGVFVLSHMKRRFVFSHRKIRAVTHKDSCIHTATDEKTSVGAKGYGLISVLNTDSNFI